MKNLKWLLCIVLLILILAQLFAIGERLGDLVPFNYGFILGKLLIIGVIFIIGKMTVGLINQRIN